MKKKWNTLIVGCLMLIVILTGCRAAMDDTESEVLEKEDTETAVPIDPSKIIFSSDKDMDITVSEVDIETGKEEEWIVTNVYGDRNLFCCDYKDSDIYYLFTYRPSYEECREILLFDGDKHYYITGDDIDTYKKTLVKLGQINQVTFVFGFYAEKDEDTMDFQNVIRRGESIRGTFTQSDSNDVFSYEGTLKKEEGIVKYASKREHEQPEYGLHLNLYWNGVKIQELREFIYDYIVKTNYLYEVEVHDFNHDGFLDIGIKIFGVEKGVYAKNYYIYDPSAKEFVLVPVADDLGIGFRGEHELDDGRFYMVSGAYADETRMKGVVLLWQWNQYKIEKFAEIEYCFTDETGDRWTACVTGCDANGNVIGKRHISSNTDDWDAVWMEAERYMLIGCGTVWNGLHLELNNTVGMNFIFQPISEGTVLHGKIRHDDAKIKKDTKGDNSQTQSVVRNANATVHDSDSDFEITLGTLFSDFTYEEEITSEVVNNRIGTVEVDGKYHDWYFHDYGDISLYTTDYNEITGDMSGHNVYIMQIVLHTPRFETARGISVGAGVTELKDAYWDGLIYDRREESYQYIEDGINISFYIKKGIVKEISIFYAEGRS